MTPATMKCLSVLNPWPWFIFDDDKNIENRSWPTRFRGSLLIHAGKSDRLVKGGEAKSIRYRLNTRGPVRCCNDPMTLHETGKLTYGAIVGVVHLSWCTSHRAEAIAKSNEFNPRAQISPEVFADPADCSSCYWIFAAKKRFVNPIPYKGAQGLFEVPLDVVAAELDLIKWRVAP